MFRPSVLAVRNAAIFQRLYETYVPTLHGCSTDDLTFDFDKSTEPHTVLLERKLNLALECE